MPKATQAQRIAFKTSLDKIYRRSVELGLPFTKNEIEADIKINAGFEWESTKHPEVTTDDMYNLTIHTDLYSEKFGLYNCYPSDEIREGDDFNPERIND